MNHRHRLGPVLSALAVGLFLATGCSAQHGAGVDARTTTSSPSSAAPLGLIAIGHSGLTGENSDPRRPGQPAPENSWATGTSTQVDSVYRRLVAQRPQEAGHVANAAVGGAKVTSLSSQAQEALARVPAPELVIIQTIDNDIRCDGTDSDNVAAFGHALGQALESINAASPQSTILLVGQLGRPRTAYVTQLVTADPSAKNPLTGNGVCDFYDEQGTLRPAAFTALTTIVDSYEAEEARICAAATKCHTDEGLRARWTDKLEYFTHDWNHLNVTGLAQEARMMWPVVADLLNLSVHR